MNYFKTAILQSRPNFFRSYVNVKMFFVDVVVVIFNVHIMYFIYFYCLTLKNISLDRTY